MPKQATHKHYHVSWAIDIEARSPLDAARRVAAWMRNFTPDDDIFEVTDITTKVTTEIDLDKHPKQRKWTS